LIHPSVGLQLAMLAAASWIAWAVARHVTGVGPRRAALALGALALAMLPWAFVYLRQAGSLFAGLPREEFRLLCVELQNPQHMLPHLWRLPQWLAFACYPILALLALGQAPAPWPPARFRFALVLVVNLAGLGLAWYAVEVLQNLDVTVFQPFRMATTFRGLALVAVAGRIASLWGQGHFAARGRAGLLAVGLAGDWMLVVATTVDLVMTGLETVAPRSHRHATATATIGGAATLGLGLVFLARHDTESGQVPILASLAAGAVVSTLVRGRTPGWNRRRIAWALAGCWAIPLAALLATTSGDQRFPGVAALVERCRFAAVPTDDLERLAVWCRAHTPADARFIAPPGPKTFRLWSERSVAFNRAGSPYHAAGLADWGARFRDHVDFEGSVADLVRAYRRDRHGLERRYEAMGDAERAALAGRQGASYVVAAPSAGGFAPPGSPLELLHVEGRHAVYRVRDPGPGPGLARRPAPKLESARPQARTVVAASAGTG
jgi:hypothetical protein